MTSSPRILTSCRKVASADVGVGSNSALGRRVARRATESGNSGFAWLDYRESMTLQGAQFRFRLDHLGLGQDLR